MEKRKEIVLKVGNDNGNSEHDIIINGTLIRQPNVFAKIRRLPNLDEVNKDYVITNMSDNLIVTCEDPSGVYYIGNYALSSGHTVRNIEVGVDNNKVDSDIVVVNTLAQIAGFGVKMYLRNTEEYQESDGMINITVDMTTALPVSYYTNKTATEFAAKFMDKTHLVTVHIGDMKIRTKIKFDYVKVIPEGVTGVFALLKAGDEMFKEYNRVYNDKLTGEYFEDARVLHIAIGEGTTEFPVTTGIEFNPNFIKGTNNGVGHVIDKVLEEFKNTVGLVSYSRQDYSKVLINKSHKFHNLAMDLADPYFEEEAELILRHARKEIERAGNEIDVICVYGGGSIFMRKYLEKKLEVLCNRAGIKLLYVPQDYAVTLEATGLYNFTTSELFEILKANYKK